MTVLTQRSKISAYLSSLSILLVLITSTACGARTNSNNQSQSELQTRSSVQVSTLEAQSRQISQNAATLEAQSVKINEQAEIISLQSTLEFQSTIISEQKSQIENLTNSNWVIILLSVFLGPAFGVGLVYGTRYVRNQYRKKLESKERTVSQSSTIINSPLDQNKSKPSTSELRFTQEGSSKKNASHKVDIEPEVSKKGEPKNTTPSKNTLEQRVVERTEIYTEQKKVIHRRIEQKHSNGTNTTEQHSSKGIEIDFNQVAALQQESVNIRERLIVHDNDETSEQLKVVSLAKSGESTEPKNQLESLVQQDEFKKVLLVMWQSDWQATPEQLKDVLTGKFLNVILDNLNEQSVEILGDNLIYEEDGILFVTEEFRASLTEQLNTESL